MNALEGLRVLDLSRLAPGPYCSMLLSDFGAEVLMVETLEDAIVARAESKSENEKVQARSTEQVNTKYGSAGHTCSADQSNAFQALRRNKRSICLNLKHAEGRKILHQLVSRSDIFLEGFRPGVTKRLGADYKTLKNINPGLIYCSLTGFGQEGPYSHLGGHDINYLAVAGVLSMFGRAGENPTPPMNLIADYGAGGLFAAFGILTALFAREKTKLGQHIDSSMTDGVISFMAKQASFFFQNKEIPQRGLNRLNGGWPIYDSYKCSDGKFIAIGALETKFLQNLLNALDLNKLMPKNLDNRNKIYSDDKDDEINHLKILREQLNIKFATRTRDEWFSLFREVDACCTPVLELDEVFNDPHMRARKMRIDIPDDRFGVISQVGVAPKLSGTPGNVRSLGVSPGSTTQNVLSELGYSRDQIVKLKFDNVIS